MTKKKFSTHYYASVKLIGLENVLTMDLIGKDLGICVHPDWKDFLIWEEEYSQTAWRPIKTKKDAFINILAVYQKGREISVYINNEHVEDFKRLKTPSPGPIGIQIKANPQTGGKMQFKDFVVWEY